MKEKIQKLAEGIFENNGPEIRLSTTSIGEVVGECAQFSGHFFVESLSGADVEGYVYPSHVRVKCQTTRFSGKNCQIDYEVDLRGLAFGDEVSGIFTLITNGGEFTIPCTFTLEKGFYESPSGPVKNLFHFANFAREDWDGAVKFFGSDDFKHLLINNDQQYRLLYQGLKKEKKLSQAMDEFLVRVHKKERVHISLAEEERTFESLEKKEKFSFIVKKSTWGYLSASVKAEGSFIQVEKSSLSAEDFLGNSCELSYFLDPETLHGGLNLGCIRIETPFETLSYKISVNKKDETPLWEIEEKLLSGKISLMRHYLDFRKKKINHNAFSAQSLAILEEMEQLEQENPLFTILKIQFLLIGKKEQEAGWYLDSFEKAKDLKEQDVGLYGYYLYLQACYKKEPKAIKKAVEEIRSLYKKHDDSFPLLWSLCYLDEELAQHPARKWELLKEQFLQGCNSPLLYLEACLLLVEHDTLLKSLDAFTLQVLNFAIKEEMFHAVWCERILGLSIKGMAFSNLLFKIYKKIYVMLPIKERLSVLLGLLIREQKLGGEYTKWYALGIEKNLKIAGLFENYMDSIHWNQEETLPQNLLLYYAMEEGLPERKKAWLFARILKQKEQTPMVYKQCREMIRKFVLKQRKTDAMNEDLAVLYEDFLQQELAKAPAKRDPDLNSMSERLFWNKIQCHQKDIIEILVLHQYQENEEVYACQNQAACIPLFTQDDQIILVDRKGRKYADPKDYTLTPLFPEKRLFSLFSEPSFGMMLRTEMEGERYRSVSLENLGRIEALTKDLRLQPEYRNELTESLISFYQNSGMHKELRQALSDADLESFTEISRDRILDIMLAEGAYEQAWPILEQYGFSNMIPGKLVGILSWRIQEVSYELESTLIKLCQQTFQAGKYNETMLRYLTLYAEGDCRSLRALWQAAVGFGLETEQLGERLLTQLLWTETELSGLEALLMEQEEKGENKTLLKAYLVRAAYACVVQEKHLDDDLWRRMERILEQEESMPILCKLAWLKAYSEKKGVEGNRKLLLACVAECKRKSLVFPFFKQLEECSGCDLGMEQQVVITYKAHPESRLMLHYMIKDGSQKAAAYIKEPMKHRLAGIFTRQFTLFYGERLEYYITKADGEESEFIHQEELAGEPPRQQGSSRMALLGRMAAEEEEEMLTALDEYITLDYMTEELFKIR